MSKKIISYFLIFAIAISMVVAVPTVASATSSSVELLVDSDSVSGWDSFIERNALIGTTTIEGIITLDSARTNFWRTIDGTYSESGIGSFDSLESLKNAAYIWSKRIAHNDSAILNGFFRLFFSMEHPTAVVAYDSVLGVYRFRDSVTGAWLVNSMGHFAFYRPDSSSGDTGTTISPTGQWINTQKVGSQTVLWHVVSYYELNELREEWLSTYSCTIVDAGNYYWLVRTNYTASFVLCDKYGMPYYLPKDNQSALTTDKNYYTGVGDSYVDDSTTNNYYDYSSNDYSSTDNSTNVSVYDNGAALIGSPIDVNNGTINVGGEIQYIDNMTYDASTQTYYVDAHTEYKFDVDFNYYYTYNYSYKYEYYINYTSVTYIGQTEEYDERYEYYYELPDGRSSADLTAEDLEQLSFVFADVVNYARSADDLNLRALYHFDGNTEDDSYWSYCTAFDWDAGASLTYMDEGTFNGSLYLDETEHDFTITLPGRSDLSYDFTLQFRYYQSATITPVSDSYVMLGTSKVLLFDGAYYYTPSGTAFCSTSVGSWNEICIMSYAGYVYWYINGVCYGRDSFSASGGTITFHFGSSQQTYKKIDELRFTRAAVYAAGQNYTPTSVPFDTNLSLILPDGERPMADEVMVYTPSENNLLTDKGLADWTSGVPSVTAVSSHSIRSSYSSVFGNGPKIVYNPSYTSLSASDGSVSASSTQDGLNVYIQTGTSGYSLPNYLFLPVLGYRTSTSSSGSVTANDFYSFGTSGKTYTLSVVLSDGQFSSITFTLSTKDITVNNNSSTSPVSLSCSSVLSYGVLLQSEQYYYCYGISIVPSSDAEIAYMELVEGSEPQFSIGWEMAVYSSGELEDSPVLAVRTNQEITSYQIGGVRPSYPTKGLVYALVESGYITSLQIYTGVAWEAVDGRIWTGSRWVPYSYFNVLTLQDYYDSIGGSGSDYEYIYTESGFWAWFQKQWNSFMDKLDLIIEKLGISSGSDCEHVYTTEIQREATCAEPGHMLSTCDNCGDSYTELIEPAGHDWIVQDHVDEVLDEEGNVVEEGYDILVCSVCELETKDYGDGPVENDLFDAIGDLIADGVDWILEKLALVADSLSGITDTFNSFIARIEGMTGDYTLMFGAFLTLLPEDLRILMWLAIIAGVVGLVWSGWTK